MRGRGLAAAAAMAAACVLGMTGAGAQISPFRAGPNAPRLGPGDWDMIWQTAAAVNADPAARPGTAKDWRNPATQNAGTVTLQRVFEQGGMPCHALRYTIMAKSRPAPSRYDMTWCRTKAGEWKIAE